MGDVLAYSGAMRRLAVEVGKVASDLRLLSMGPRAGLVRDRAAGGAARVVDHAGQGQSVGAGDGQPGVLPGDGLRHDGRARLRGRTARAERDDAGHRLERAARVDDPARGDAGAAGRDASTASPPTPSARRELLDRSTAAATALSPYIGYAATAEIAKESVQTGRSIRELVLERGLLDAEAARRDPVGRSDDARRNRRRSDERAGQAAVSRPDREAGASRCGMRCVDRAALSRSRRRWPPSHCAGLACAAAAAAPAAAGAAAAARRAGCSRRRISGCSKRPIARQWQKPDQIMDALGIADGAVVADLGAGGGWFTMRLARRVGPNGLVYAEDIQPQMIEAISRRVQREDLHERADGARHADRSAAAARPRRRADRRRLSRDGRSGAARGHPDAAAATSRGRSKPQGRLGIVDFTPGGGGPGPQPKSASIPSGDRRGRGGRPEAAVARTAFRRFSSCWCSARSAAAPRRDRRDRATAGARRR